MKETDVVQDGGIIDDNSVMNELRSENERLNDKNQELRTMNIKLNAKINETNSELKKVKEKAEEAEERIRLGEQRRIEEERIRLEEQRRIEEESKPKETPEPKVKKHTFMLNKMASRIRSSSTFYLELNTKFRSHATPL